MDSKTQNNISWDDYFMSIAIISSLRSKDPNTQVGACIVENNIICGIGYNGMPRGFENNEKNWCKKNKHLYVVHAEANAILNSRNTMGYRMLYSTLFPCNECAKLIIQNGISEVIYMRYKTQESEKYTAAKRLFQEVGIKCRFLHMDLQQLGAKVLSF